MSRIVLWSVLLVVLVSSALMLMPRAEAWSEPVYTKPWTEEEAEEEEEEIDEFLLDFTSLYGTW